MSGREVEGPLLSTVFSVPFRHVEIESRLRVLYHGAVNEISEASHLVAPREEPATLAAVDLGSNSFRMVIARVVGDGLQLVDRLREGVRLAAHLDEEQHISPEGRARALACLRKFGQRLRDLPDTSVRAVGTNTLRKAKDRERFLRDAEHALGHPIEVVSGQEEARLIFLGVAHSLGGGESARRLVIDIGGGSTEMVIGDGFDPVRAESLYMGCVGYTLTHFPKGKITAKRLDRAQTAASLELRAHDADFRRLGWEQAVGASGTILAITDILRQQGWSEQGVTAEGLGHLRQALLAAGHVDALDLEGLGRERARVLPGGFAILAAAFERLSIGRLIASPGAMREGLLYDLLGRLRHEDARDRTIQRFVEQYRVDVAQAARVEATALEFLEQAADAWSLDRAENRAFLSWASRLHEIGLAIAHGGFHKHGMYLLEHSDMSGFSFQNQRLLALLVRGQRRKLRVELFEDALPEARARQALRLCVLLRLACLLNRPRSDRRLPELRLRAKKTKLILSFPAGWLDEHPLTRADLEREVKYLKAAGLRLRVRTYDSEPFDSEIADSDEKPRIEEAS